MDRIGRCAGLVITAAAGCSGVQVLGEGVESSRGTPIAVREACHEAPSDHLAIIGAELSEDELLLQVRHAGGCEEHDYQLCPSDRLLVSEPPQQDLVLVHDAHGDLCEAELNVTLSVSRAELPAVDRLEGLKDRRIRVILDGDR